MRIFDSLSHYTDRVRPILVRHEQAASVMADIYGRLTGRPAVARGFGAEGLRVEDPAEIQDAVKEALKKGRPTVVDVITDGTVGLESISSGATVG